MTVEIETNAIPKASLLITLAGTVLHVEDGLGNPGGNVRIRPGRPLRFSNKTGYRCAISFLELADAEEPDLDCASSTWIFDESKPAECTRLLDSDTEWKAKLRSGMEVVVVKYTIALPDRSDVPPLDPIIIVRP
jgi:hypothetical protein